MPSISGRNDTFSLTCSDPEEVEKLYAMGTASIREAAPEFRGPIEVEQSVDEQLALLDKMTVDESGSFLNGTGTDGNDPSGV